MFLLPDVRKVDREETVSFYAPIRRTASSRRYTDMRRKAEPRRRKTSIDSFPASKTEDRVFNLTEAVHVKSKDPAKGSFSTFQNTCEFDACSYSHRDDGSESESDVYALPHRPFERGFNMSCDASEKTSVSNPILSNSISNIVDLNERRIPYSCEWPGQLDNLTLSTSHFPNDLHCQQIGLSCTDSEAQKSQYLPRVVLNVGGTVFETYETTLAAHPDTLLGDPARRMKYFNRHTGEFVFHKRFNSFDAILFFYQSKGILAKPHSVDQMTFESELKFFEIPFKGSMCISHKHREAIRSRRALQHRKTPKRVLYHLFNRPFSSPLSSFIAILNIIVTLLLTVEFCISTLRRYRGHSYAQPIWHRDNHLNIIAVIEITCMVFLNVDFLVRMILARRLMKFLICKLSIIDEITMLCFYISVLIAHLSVPQSVNYLAHLFRQLRILQVFRLARYSYGFRALLQTIANSLAQLGSFMLIIPVMSMFFASITFFAEDYHNSLQEACHNRCRTSSSLSDWFWYSIITITTVGYGDVYPRSILGKLVGAICALFGVILFCLLTPIIFRNFVEYYYIKRLLSIKLSPERRKLAEKVREMYYEQYNDF